MGNDEWKGVICLGKKQQWQKKKKNRARKQLMTYILVGMTLPSCYKSTLCLFICLVTVEIKYFYAIKIWTSGKKNCKHLIALVLHNYKYRCPSELLLPYLNIRGQCKILTYSLQINQTERFWYLTELYN